MSEVEAREIQITKRVYDLLGLDDVELLAILTGLSEFIDNRMSGDSFYSTAVELRGKIEKARASERGW